MRYEWIDGETADEATWQRIESILSTRGWMSLNRFTARVRAAFGDDGSLNGFIVFQLVPHLGPAYVVPSERGSGIMDRLVNDVATFMDETHARGVMVVAGNPSVAQMCKQRGLHRIESPVFTTEVQS